MDRDEEVRCRGVGARGPLLERDEAIVVSREEHPDPLPREDRSDAPGDVQRDVLLADSVRTDGAGVPPAVARIEDHLRDLARAAR